jgi:phage/plasmid-associated DNA primase
VVFDHFQSKRRFLRANKIKQLIEPLVLVLQVNELGDEKIHCFQNGVFFSKDKKFVEFSDEGLKNVVLSSVIPLNYSSKVRDIPEIWKQFLKKLFEWKTVKAEDILVVMTAHTMGLVDLQAIYFLGGAPRSGKSLVMRLITDLFKPLVAFFTVSGMNANPRFFLSFLVDKIMICFPDARIEKMSQSGLDMLKHLTGYDTLTVETKGLTTTNTITGKFPGLITSQSDLTWVQDPGITRRLVYLHFNESIP